MELMRFGPPEPAPPYHPVLDWMAGHPWCIPLSVLMIGVLVAIYTAGYHHGFKKACDYFYQNEEQPGYKLPEIM